MGVGMAELMKGKKGNLWGTKINWKEYNLFIPQYSLLFKLQILLTYVFEIYR